MVKVSCIFLSLWDSILPHFFPHSYNFSLDQRLPEGKSPSCSFSFCHFVFQGWGNEQPIMQWILFNDVLHCIQCSLNNQRLTASLGMPRKPLHVRQKQSRAPALGSSSARNMCDVILPWLTCMCYLKVLEFSSIFQPQRKRRTGRET